MVYFFRVWTQGRSVGPSVGPSVDLPGWSDFFLPLGAVSVSSAADFMTFADLRRLHLRILIKLLVLRRLGRNTLVGRACGRRCRRALKKMPLNTNVNPDNAYTITSNWPQRSSKTLTDYPSRSTDNVTTAPPNSYMGILLHGNPGRPSGGAVSIRSAYPHQIGGYATASEHYSQDSPGMQQGVFHIFFTIFF